MTIPAYNLSSSHVPVRGRFAPSPTGSLHLGSLVAALGSYLIAKQAGGEWLVRIEDLDPPREIEGSSKQILQTLEAFSLHWDGPIVYQSQRNTLYQQKYRELIEQQIVYQCSCSRKIIENRNKGIYDGFCRDKNLSFDSEGASRIVFAKGYDQFEDHLLGHCCFQSAFDQQDFVIKRRDGLFAYQLAVVVDDIEQGINQIVRGKDILDSTPRQNFIYHCFKKPLPDYYHLPLVLDDTGGKLCKRFKSPRIEESKATELLLGALTHLGQKIEPGMQQATPEELINFYTHNWQTDDLVASLKQNTMTGIQ